MNINVLDLFSGIGGFSAGLSQSEFNIQNHYFSELDKHAIAVYKHKFPEAKYAGSVTDVRGANLPRIDAITFGSPCQDFSIAGKREGLEGGQSSLIREAIRVICECRPQFFIWENVKGVFSSNDGADFWAVIQAFTNIGGYRLEWQLLNTAWFLPQNRERIYLVGILGGEGERSVFPVTEKLKRVDEGAVKASDVRTITAGGNSGGMHSSMTLIQSFRRNENQKLRVKDAKGNMISVGTWRTHKDGQGFRGTSDGNAPTIPARARAREDGSGQPVIKIGAIRGRNIEGQSKTKQVLEINNEYHSNTLTSVQKDNVAVQSGGAIRRLTEIECERLQGFSDDWTKYGNYDGETKAVSATQRYKCLGNAVSVPVVRAVGESIIRVLA